MGSVTAMVNKACGIWHTQGGCNARLSLLSPTQDWALFSVLQAILALELPVGVFTTDAVPDSPTIIAVPPAALTTLQPQQISQRAPQVLPKT